MQETVSLSGPLLGLFGGLFCVVVVQTALLWRKMGQLESAVKKSCPFGTCPLQLRAIKDIEDGARKDN